MSVRCIECTRIAFVNAHVVFVYDGTGRGGIAVAYRNPRMTCVCLVLILPGTPEHYGTGFGLWSDSIDTGCDAEICKKNPS